MFRPSKLIVREIRNTLHRTGSPKLVTRKTRTSLDFDNLSHFRCSVGRTDAGAWVPPVNLFFIFLYSNRLMTITKLPIRLQKIKRLIDQLFWQLFLLYRLNYVSFSLDTGFSILTIHFMLFISFKTVKCVELNISYFGVCKGGVVVKNVELISISQWKS